MANPYLPQAQTLRQLVVRRLESLGLTPCAEVTEDCEIVITIGGDGTVLRAPAGGKPVLGIHAGSVGFLTEIDQSELALLERLATGEYIIEERLRLRASFGGTELSALNDIAVTVTPERRGRHCAVINAMEDGVVFASYRGDGVIFATPTGSTGYSLSAGGAVVDPLLDAILLTPLHSHSLGVKPLVFRGGARLSVEAPEELSVSADGGEVFILPAGSPLELRRDETPARFVRLKELPFASRLGRLQHKY
jgi:NAD+ kinase